MHSRDLIEVDGSRRLLVCGKGGKQRMVPVPDYNAALIRESGDGWAFPVQSVVAGEPRRSD
jgi:hypothetical protein